MKRVREIGLVVAAVVLVILFAQWYLETKRDCDARGGVLVRGAWLPFACVARS